MIDPMAAAAPDSPRRPTLRVALLGAGGIGMVHAQNIVRGHGSFAIDAVADPDPIALDRAGTSLRAECSPDWADVVASRSVDAVLICSASAAHAEQVVTAAESGKHVFCEKPLALTVADCDRAIDAADRAGVVLQVGFNRRFDANAKALKEEVLTGRLGQLLLGRITSRDPEPPPPEHRRSPEGLFVESSIHDFDMARFLLGEEPVELASYAGALFDPLALEGGDNDTAVTVLRFGSGTIVTIENCRRSASGYDQRMELHGADGSARTENVRPVAMILDGPAGSTASPGAWFYPERYADSYAAELVSFRNAIDGGPVEATGHDGRQALALALAAVESSTKGTPARFDVR
jgi:myo-inositol 2-dehydrogenase/D-chiro-inositol 1-dehydrogenase